MYLTNGTVAIDLILKHQYILKEITRNMICLASWSTKYSVFISRIGESDLLTDEFISQQPYLGSLFKSQNASTWEPSQWEDLKFVINTLYLKPVEQWKYIIPFYA